MHDELDINGDWPTIEGNVLHELLCTEMWFQGELVDPANVVYLKVGDNWYRHYFDCGIIFWRTEVGAPIAFSMEELDSHFEVVNLAEKFKLSGLTLSSVEPTLLSNGSETKFVFSNGSFIIFSNVNDVTSYRT